MKPTLLVMAAGMGSRYGGIKQIDPVGPGGEAIVDYSVYDAQRAGFGKIVFIIRKAIESDIKEFFHNRFDGSLEISYVFQELDNLPEGFTVPEGRVKPWGTAHAILSAKDAVREPFAVINADDFYGQDAYKVMADFLLKADPALPDFSMVGYRLDNTLSENGSVSRGICETDTDGCLQSVVEHLKIEKTAKGIISTDGSAETLFTGAEIASMNLFGFTPEIFPYLEKEFLSFLRVSGPETTGECYIPRVVDTLVKARKARVKVLLSSASWFGITYQADKPDVVKRILSLVEKGDYPRKLNP